MIPASTPVGMSRFGVALVLGVVLAILAGCARLVSLPPDDMRARAVVDALAVANSDVVQFKGIGSLRLESQGQVLSGRMAWAATSLDKLRVEWLNMLGQPMTSLAGDGRYITIVTMNDRKLHRLKQKKKALAGVIHVPVGIEDFVALLAGRLPLSDYAAAWMVADQADSQHIQLKDRWNNVLAAVEVEKPTHRPRAMTVFDGDGEVQYRIEWISWQEADGLSLPRRIQIATGGPEYLTLSLERYWLDAGLPLEAFVLTAPD